MKFEDFKGKTKDELNKLVLEAKKELFNLRFQRTTGELEKTHRFKQVRRTIARVKTYLASTEEKQVNTGKAAKAPAKKSA